jgi:uncharacterized protein (DUF1800 family)
MLERERLGHLLRRTGFAATPCELGLALATGYQATVERLMQGLAQAWRPSQPPPLDPLPNLLFPFTLLTFGRGVVWWLGEMVRTGCPLGEKLTLFWHRRFATSGEKVFRPGWMFSQNLTLRRHAAGPYADLLLAMMTDPALLRWLDAENNSIERPNENLGRELLELFTVGRGHYDETDVKELARLTTGQYDGPVHLLGKRGAEDFRQVLARLAVHPATADRLVTELWDDLAAAPLPREERERLVGLWRTSRGNVSLVVREMLRSPSFFGGLRQRVTSPVEFAVGCWRLLGRREVGLTDIEGFDGAGELLFFPPSVKGWDKGLSLIHPAAVQSRLELVSRWVDQLDDDHPALMGLAQSPNRAAYLVAWSGGHLQAETLRDALEGLDPRDSLKLALTSPQFWTS